MKTNTRKSPAIYIANLGEYNNGRLVGTWIDLPLTCEEYYEVTKTIMTDEYNEELDNFEIAIHDYENFPFDVHEYDNILELIDRAYDLDSLSNEEYKVLEALIDELGYDYDDAYDVVSSEDYRIYDDCSSMAEVAEYIVEECYSDLPEIAKRYFDYEKLGADLEMESTFCSLGKNRYLEVIR